MVDTGIDIAILTSGNSANIVTDMGISDDAIIDAIFNDPAIETGDPACIGGSNDTLRFIDPSEADVFKMQGGGG